MKLKRVFLVAAVYMTLIGVGHLFAPVAMSAGVVPENAPAGLVAFLRHYSSLFLALALLNFLARNSAPSDARAAIVAANLVAFGLAALLDLAAVFGGAGPSGLVPAAMNGALAIAFFICSRDRRAS